MYSRKIILFILFIFTFLSGITWTAGEAGSGITGRLIFADLIGVGVIFLFFAYVAIKKIFYWNQLFTIFVFFLFFNLISLVFSSYPDKGVIEYLTHVFIFLVTISFYNIILYQKLDLNYLSEVIKVVVWASALIASIGLLQFFVFPSLFNNSFGGLSGTFRNTGQAGAYFSIFIALAIAGLTSGLLKKNPINFVALFLLVMALIFTFKRAALIGILIGLFLLLIKFFISKNINDKKYLLFAIFIFIGLGFIVTNLFLWAGENIDGVMWRATSKFNTDTADDFVEGFLAENIHATLMAFEDSPVIGVGMGNMAGIYTAKYEIHSTYMSVLSASGLIGLICYGIFMFTTLKRSFLNYRVNEVNSFLINLGILYIGLMISWTYTYHIRKREFWILLLIILLVMAYGRIQQKILSLKNIR